jgi:hypothetical protein
MACRQDNSIPWRKADAGEGRAGNQDKCSRSHNSDIYNGSASQVLSTPVIFRKKGMDQDRPCFQFQLTPHIRGKQKHFLDVWNRLKEESLETDLCLDHIHGTVSPSPKGNT